MKVDGIAYIIEVTQISFEAQYNLTVQRLESFYGQALVEFETEFIVKGLISNVNYLEQMNNCYQNLCLESSYLPLRYCLLNTLISQCFFLKALAVFIFFSTIKQRNWISTLKKILKTVIYAVFNEIFFHNVQVYKFFRYLHLRGICNGLI
ncbi:hypothetical protein [Neobacillus sp. NPDC093127]|uniref:hypothetical protein n=1 Tax=Neobacillus sp. NPDC093127 TaxID=3364296 RepID=UPI0038038103